MENVLLTTTDAEKYRGMYVAFPDSESRVVIAGGKDPEAVLVEAARQGFEVPLLVFIPESDAVWIGGGFHTRPGHAPARGPEFSFRRDSVD